MRHLLLVAALFNGQATASSFHPLPMGEVQACAVEYASQAVLSGTWGGQIATYDAIVDADGAVVSLKRRIVDGREHLPPLVKLNQFEQCIRRWRFGERGEYEVSLFGGTLFGVEWVIQVSKGNSQFRLRMPARLPD